MDAMHQTVTVMASDIALEMRSNPEFGMEVLAAFVEGLDPDDFATDGVVNQYHEMAAPALRNLAEAIEETMRAD